MGSRYDQSGIPRDEPSEYQKAVEAVFLKYEHKMLDLMNRLRDGLRESGFKDVEEVEDDSVEDYRKRFAVYESETDDTKKVDLTLILAESAQYEGSEDGITWRLEIVRWDGRILGGFEPFNYTDQCWVQFPQGKHEYPNNLGICSFCKCLGPCGPECEECRCCTYEEAIEARWQLFDTLDASDLPKLIREGIEK